MSEKWFGPKPLGYGVVPIHWKGWAVFWIYVLTIVPFSLWSSLNERVVLCLSGSLALTAVLLWICKVKGPQSWRASDHHDRP